MEFFIFLLIMVFPWFPPIGNRCRETAKGRRSHEQDGQHAADEDAAAGPRRAQWQWTYRW